MNIRVKIMNRHFIWGALVTLLSLQAYTGVNAEESKKSHIIPITAINWCPQLCSGSARPGYVMDTINTLFKGSSYQIKSVIYPWTRAIQSVRNGNAYALLSPAKAEAPDLRFPKQPIGVQRMCFFSRQSSSWRYSGVDSLKGLRIGIAYDTSIAELNEYVTHNKGQFNYFPYDDDYINRSLNMVKENRLDTFLFTYNSTMYAIAQFNMSDDIKPAGCVSAEPIYMAFSPDPNLTEQIDHLLVFFDAEMEKLRKTDEIKIIMAKYGLEDWQPHLPE